MALFKRLFGRRDDGPEAEQAFNAVLERVRPLCRPALHLVSTTDTTTRSRIGGLPMLSPDTPWPTWKDAPLTFLCQIDLSAIPADFDAQGLPRTGLLHFFYCQEQETWGFDPNDRGSWCVLHEPDPPPQARAAPEGLSADGIYKARPVAMKPILTWPDLQDERLESREWSRLLADRYSDHQQSVFDGPAHHHLFGLPEPIQGNDMDLECQLVSSGRNCGSEVGYKGVEAARLEGGRRDWLLLLQLDTDDRVNMMWGDCGRLYFWIRRADLNQHQFAACWMVLQCY